MTENPYGNYSNNNSSYTSYGQQPSSSVQPQYGYDQNSPYSAGGYSNLPHKPRPHVGLGQALKNWFRYLFHFSGRASRSEFWWVQGLTMLISSLVVGGWLAFALTAVFRAVDAQDAYQAGDMSYSEYQEIDNAAMMQFFGSYLIPLILGLIFAVLLIAITWRRLQDAGFPGALFLLSLIGLGIVPLILCFFPSSPKGYQYDKPIDIDRA